MHRCADGQDEGQDDGKDDDDDAVGVSNVIHIYSRAVTEY